MELSRAFDGNGFLCRDAGAAIPSITGVGREPGRKFTLAAFSHLDAGGVWSQVAPKLFVDSADTVRRMDRQDLVVPASPCGYAGICEPGICGTDLWRCDGHFGFSVLRITVCDRIGDHPNDACHRRSAA